MTCWNVKRRSNDFVDGRLRRREHSKLEAHLRKCDECAVRVDEIRSVRRSLEKLSSPTVPASLRSKLLVLASKERQFLIESNGSRLLQFWNSWKFRLDQLMRSLTIPATGGVLSSVLLFGALAFTIGTTTRQVAYEIPILYTEHMDANLVPLQLRSSVVMTLSMDGRGHITDYAGHNSSASFAGSGTQLQYNNITMPEFPSVLAMAQPTIGDIRIYLRPIVFRQ